MRIIAIIKGDDFIERKMQVCEYNERDCLLRWSSTAIFNFVRVMRLFGKSGVAVLMASCLVTSLLMPVFAMDFLGVNEGDWALYTVEATWHSDIPEDTMPQYLDDINHTEWRLQVKQVLDTESVRLSLTKYYRNGTEMSVEIYEGNVKTGSGNLSMWIVRKNLEVHNRVYEDEDLAVNDTVSHGFAGATRLTVYAWFVQEEEAGGNTTGRYAIWWDKETGILCGGISTTIRIVEEKYLSMIVIRTNIDKTSLWEPSSDTFWLFGIMVTIIVLVLAVAVFVQKRRKLKQRKTRKRST